MKILVLSQHWWPENGVQQRRWTWLTQLLAEEGHEVTVLVPPPHYQQTMTVSEWWERRRQRVPHGSTPNLGPSGERIIRSGFFPAGPSLTQKIFNQATVALGAIWATLRKPGALSDYQPDLVIGTVPALPTAAATYVAARRLGVGYIIDLRDAWPDLLEQSDKWNAGTGKVSLRERVLRRGPLQLVKQLTKTVLNHVLRSADAIIATSSDLAEDLQRRPELMVGERLPKVVTIRNVFPAETSFDKSARTEEPGDALKVLYAGTLGRAQDLSNALKAAVIAREQGVNIQLRLSGAGVAKPALQEFARTHRLDATFEGRRPADGLEELYDWADTALVHLADWRPLSMAVPSKTYELMNNGIHISGVLAGEAAKMITTSGAGDVVAPAQPDKLADMWVGLARDRQRLRVGPEAKAWVEQERAVFAPRALRSVLEHVVGGGV